MPLDNEDLVWLADFQRETLLYLAGVKQRLAQHRNSRLEYILREMMASVEPAVRKALLGAHTLTEEPTP